MKDANQLDRLSSLIAKRTGLNTFDRGRARLIEVLHHHPEATQDLKAYTIHLEILGESHPIWQALLSELTVGETYFLRDTPQIQLLRQHILPTLINDKRRDNHHTLRLWSAGCATGEEAYTLAILLHELIPDRYLWDIRVLGTDINDAALEVAQSGRYRDWSFRNTSPTIRKKHFITIHHTTPIIYEIHPDIRQMVNFRHHNLVSDPPGMYDVVICRNVIIYFTHSQAKSVEQQLAKSLDTWGWLLLGSAETLQHTRRQYLVRHFDDALAFQKLGIEQQAVPSNRSSAAFPTPAPHITAFNPTVETTYRQAVRALQNGQPEQTIALLQTIMDEHYSAAVHSLMASALVNIGDKETAHLHLMQALEADTLYPDAHYLLALLHMEDKDWVAARIAIRAAIYCRPDFALAHLLSGDMFVQEGEFERAERAWTTARRFASEVPPDMRLSDVAEIKAGQLVTLVDSRLGEE